MSEPLWVKSHTQVDAALQRFTAGDDVILDREFFIHDIRASRAHVEGLQRIGILTVDEAYQLDKELAALAEDFERGEFVLDARYEDGHSAIEARLTERLGDVGRKVHTGRSRNDQDPGRNAAVAARAPAGVACALHRDRQRLSCTRAIQKRCRCPATRICSVQWCRPPRCGMRASPRPSSTTPCSRATRVPGSTRIHSGRLLAMGSI